MSTKLTPSHREKHEAFVRHYCERHLLTADLKRGAHSGIFDAAHMVDAIRADLLASRRKSKERDAIEAVLKECGDAIWAMRDFVLETDADRQALSTKETER